jgi:hypothetical protein
MLETVVSKRTSLGERGGLTDILRDCFDPGLSEEVRVVSAQRRQLRSTHEDIWNSPKPRVWSQLLQRDIVRPIRQDRTRPYHLLILKVPRVVIQINREARRVVEPQLAQPPITLLDRDVARLDSRERKCHSRTRLVRVSLVDA